LVLVVGDVPNVDIIRFYSNDYPCNFCISWYNSSGECTHREAQFDQTYEESRIRMNLEHMTTPSYWHDNVCSTIKQHSKHFDGHMLLNKKTHILTVFFLAKSDPEKHRVLIKQFDVVSGNVHRDNHEEMKDDKTDSVAARGFWNKLVRENPTDELKIKA